MTDAELIAFLQRTLPELQLRWPGYRKVRARVGKQLRRRLRALNLTSLDEYLDYLGQHEDEWQTLDALCRIVVTHFYRDRGVWEAIAEQALPSLAGKAMREGRSELRVWSAGCASGEEAFTLAILWAQELQPQFPRLRLALIGTDIDERLIARAQRARFQAGSVRKLPSTWLAKGFVRDGDDYVVSPQFRDGVAFACQDLRRQNPVGPFDMIFCRNLAFTYFDEDVQRDVLDRLCGALRPGSFLVLGQHEQCPPASEVRRSEFSPAIWRNRLGRS